MQTFHKPLIIGVGGAHSGAGKTTLIAGLLSLLSGKKNPDSSGDSPSFSARTPFHGIKKWGAVKYTKTALYTSFTANDDLILQKGKDTRAFRDAGADPVIWVQAPPEELPGIMPLVLDHARDADGLFIEGNSAIEFAGADIIIFLFPSGDGRGFKKSARGVLRNAGIVLFPRTGGKIGDIRNASPPDAVCIEYDNTRYPLERIVNTMDKIISKKRIHELLTERSEEGIITCPAARGIAEELGVSYGEVGAAANELKMKIRHCELGCF